MQLKKLMLQNLQHTDIEIGLKYLNNNQELYLKILKNFLERYHGLKLALLSSEEFKDVIHTIKGLSATLGMSSLAKVAKEIDEKKIVNYEKLEFELHQVLEELKALFTYKDELKSILILNNQEHEIDYLVNCLEDHYDLLVSLDQREARELIDGEEIHLLLLSLTLKDSEEMDMLIKSIQQKNIPILLSTQSEDIESNEKFSLVTIANSRKLIAEIETILSL